MMNIAIIVDDEFRDSAVDAIAVAIAKNGHAPEVVTLSELLRSAGVGLDRRSGLLTWDEQYFARRAEAGREAVICNRVVQIGMKTAAELGDDGGMLPINFIFTAYAELLGKFTHVLGTPGANSPAGHFWPLNLQWHAVRAQLPGVTTPRFGYGIGAELVDISAFRQPMWKSLFDIYNWDVPSHQQRPDLQAFAVDKPTGQPVIAYFASDAGEAFALRAEYDLPDPVKNTLRSYAAGLRRTFNAFMGEALFFIDDDGIITFGGFSHYLKTSAGNAHFYEVLEAGFADAFSSRGLPSVGATASTT